MILTSITGQSSGYFQWQDKGQNFAWYIEKRTFSLNITENLQVLIVITKKEKKTIIWRQLSPSIDGDYKEGKEDLFVIL